MNTLIASVVTTLLFPSPFVTNGISEVSTNLPLSVRGERLQTLTLALDTTALPSNNLEIAVGCDTDGDGRLSLLETDRRFGYDCGAWTSGDVATGKVVSEPVGGTNRVSKAWTLVRREIGRSWDTMRLTIRGTAAPEAVLQTESEKTHFAIIIR